MPSLTQETIEIDDQPVFLRRAGDDDVPIVYLHGIPTSSYDWLSPLALGGGIAVDLPGLRAQRQARRPGLLARRPRALPRPAARRARARPRAAVHARLGRGRRPGLGERAARARAAPRRDQRGAAAAGLSLARPGAARPHAVRRADRRRSGDEAHPAPRLAASVGRHGADARAVRRRTSPRTSTSARSGRRSRCCAAPRRSRSRRPAPTSARSPRPRSSCGARRIRTSRSASARATPRRSATRRSRSSRTRATGRGSTAPSWRRGSSSTSTRPDLCEGAGVSRRILIPCLVAALGAAAYLLVAPPSADLAAQEYRAELGLVLWNNGWYAGHHTPGYSVLFPPLGGLLGARLTGALAAVGRGRAVRGARASPLGARARGGAAAALWFAAGTTAVLLTGRLTFLLGVAIGLGALLALAHDRRALAAALAALTTLASPVAGLFVALGAVAWGLADRRARGAAGAAIALAAIAPTAIMLVLFPQGGSEPFVASAFWPALAGTLLVAALLPAQERTLRIAALLYALALARGVRRRDAAGRQREPPRRARRRADRAGRARRAPQPAAARRARAGARLLADLSRGARRRARERRPVAAGELPRAAAALPRQRARSATASASRSRSRRTTGRRATSRAGAADSRSRAAGSASSIAATARSSTTAASTRPATAPGWTSARSRTSPCPTSRWTTPGATRRGSSAPACRTCARSGATRTGACTPSPSPRRSPTAAPPPRCRGPAGSSLRATRPGDVLVRVHHTRWWRVRAGSACVSAGPGRDDPRACPHARDGAARGAPDRLLLPPLGSVDQHLRFGLPPVAPDATLDARQYHQYSCASSAAPGIHGSGPKPQVVFRRFLDILDTPRRQARGTVARR